MLQTNKGKLNYLFPLRPATVRPILSFIPISSTEKTNPCYGLSDSFCPTTHGNRHLIVGARVAQTAKSCSRIIVFLTILRACFENAIT
jgi:hypothetical protein